MQRFRVVYRGISQESLVFSWYTHEPLDECVYQENTSNEALAQVYFTWPYFTWPVECSLEQLTISESVGLPISGTLAH